MTDWSDTRGTSVSWLDRSAPPPDPDFDPDRPTPLRDELVRQLAADEIAGHNLDPGLLDKLKIAAALGVIDPQAAPALVGTGYTVTVANPTPPTNIASVACGTPPTYTMVANLSGRGAPTYTDDALLFAGAGTPGALTAIATPTAGGSGPTSEATGTVVIVTAPGSVAAAPTQSISVQGAYTTTPNASHPSMAAPGTLPTITLLAPVAPVGTGGTTDLVVTGTGFRPDSVVYVAGIPQITQFVSATSLHVNNAPKRTTAGTSAITVWTGGTGTAATNWTFT
jgi:hypothetical protein